MNNPTRFASRVFGMAAVYGITVLLPQFFLEDTLGRHFPPPPNHPEHFYGFVGIALAWQIAFWIIARDPLRHRAVMIPAVLEKLAFGIAAPVLYFQGRLDAMTLGAGLVDLLLAALFALAFLVTRSVETST